MAGIFGICNFDERPVDRALVARMGETLSHNERDGGAVTFERSAALGIRLLRATSESASSAQPVRSASGAHLVFDGRLDNRDELIAMLRDRGEVGPSTSDAELAAGAYDIKGPDFASVLLGDFAVAVLDAGARRIVLARDGMGVRPLYYRRSPTSLWFASEIKTLLADREFQARPNQQLLAELMLRRVHRRPAEEGTLFAGVQQILPAHVGVFTRSGAERRQYWDLTTSGVDRERSTGEYAAAFNELLRRAVKRRTRSSHPVAIAVSGGLDSSAIFCAASQLPATSVIGLTYTARDGGPSDESAYVAELERATSRSIRRVATPFEGALFRSKELIRAVEAPMLNGQWFRGDRLMSAAPATGARTLLSGHWGDQLLFDQAYLVDLLRRGAWRTITAHLDEYLRWFPDAGGHEFRTQFGSDIFEYLLPRWMRYAMRAARRGLRPPAPWDDWYTASFRQAARPDEFPRPRDVTAHAHALYREVRSQYHHLCLEWNAKMGSSYGVELAFPFLDRELVQFLIGVPGTVLARDGVPKALFRTSLQGLVPATILHRRAKADFTGDVNRSTRQDFGAMVNMLSAEPLCVQLGYVDADKLQKGLKAARSALEQSKTSVISWRVTAVAALELWLRQFSENSRTDREELEWPRNSLVSAR